MQFRAAHSPLADMYLISRLYKLAGTRFERAVREITDVRCLLDSVPAIYALQADSCRTSRNAVILRSRVPTARNSGAEDLVKAMEDAMASVPGFAADFALSFYHEPLPGHCSACGDDKIVSLEPLQWRCERCKKGGALTLKDRFEYEQRRGWR